MSRAIFKIEPAAAPTPPAGYVVFYAKSTGLFWKDEAGLETPVGAKDSDSKAIVVENPTATEDLSFYFTNIAITITKMNIALVGTTPSLTVTVRHAADRSATGNEVVTGGTVVTSTTTGQDITSFNDATIPANSHIWIETTAKSGTVTSLILTIFYDED